MFTTEEEKEENVEETLGTFNTCYLQHKGHLMTIYLGMSITKKKLIYRSIIHKKISFVGQILVEIFRFSVDTRLQKNRVALIL